MGYYDNGLHDDQMEDEMDVHTTDLEDFDGEFDDDGDFDDETEELDFTH